MLRACAELRPCVINTVPVIVEGLVALIQKGDRVGDETASDVLGRLRLLTYGGGPLSPHCPPILAEHGVLLNCSILPTAPTHNWRTAPCADSHIRALRWTAYGQTELAGPVMFGRPGGDPNLLPSSSQSR